MDNSTNILSNKNPENEISPKELILKIKDWTGFLYSKWLIILIAGLVGAAIGLFYAFNQKPQYKAELTFVLEDSKSNSLGAYAGMASQFGIDLGGAGGTGVFAGDNIMEFLKSRLIIEKTLLSEVQSASGAITLAELYLNVYGYKEKWKNKPALQQVVFPVKKNRQLFTVQQDSILNMLYQGILNRCLVIDKPDRKASFISVSCITRDQLFSKRFTELLVKEATDFYMETKTKRSKSNVAKLQHTADSLENLLNKKTVSAALSLDLNRNPAKSVAMVGSELNSRDKAILQVLYGEVIKNLEIAKMTMVQETPLMQVVDVPIYPLEKKRFGKIKGIAIGGFLGGLLTVLVLIIRRLYKKIMS